jgi:sodium-dependent dicarboxylate transporter 2/3/5
MAPLRRNLPLLTGMLLCGLIWLMPAPEGLAAEGQAALAVLALCVVWWLFTPVALPVTSLVGIALLPLLGAMPVKETLALFGNQAVFFVIGVFLVASVMMQTGLSNRIALLGLRRFARSEETLCWVILLMSWGLCVVVVSHAVAALMLPIVLGVLQALELTPRSRTARRLLLSMAWGTVCGSNLTLMSSARASLALELYDGFRSESTMSLEPIGFIDFSLASVPVSLCSVLVAGLVLRILLPPEGIPLKPAIKRLNAQVREMGRVSGGEWITLAVVLGMVAAVIVSGPGYMSVVALLFSGVLFALKVLSWEDASRMVNWGVVLLYGGAIVVGGALSHTGATSWLVGTILPEGGISAWGIFAILGGTAAVFTELVSNSAVMAVLLPVALPISEQVGLSPRAVAVLAPICAGFAYILPTSTPAMAMVFGTGYLRIRDTIPGVIITVASLCLFVLLAAVLWPLVGLEVIR